MVGEWHWRRLLTVMAAATVGLCGWAAIWFDPAASRPALAASGLLFVGGVLAAGFLLLFGWVVIVEDVRPKLVGWRPQMPMTLNTELGALVGTRRFQTHPVRFWTGLVLNHRVFVGVLIFRKPEEVTFADKQPARMTRSDNALVDGRKNRG